MNSSTLDVQQASKTGKLQLLCQADTIICLKIVVAVLSIVNIYLFDIPVCVYCHLFITI